MRTLTVLLLSLYLAVVSSLAQAKTKNEARVLINHKGRIIEVAESAVSVHILKHGDTLVNGCAVPTKTVVVVGSGDDFVQFAVTHLLCTMDQVFDFRNNLGNPEYSFEDDAGVGYICEVDLDSDLPVLATPFTIRLGCMEV